jgi:hypothetical protein
VGEERGWSWGRRSVEAGGEGGGGRRSVEAGGEVGWGGVNKGTSGIWASALYRHSDSWAFTSVELYCADTWADVLYCTVWRE